MNFLRSAFITALVVPALAFGADAFDKHSSDIQILQVKGIQTELGVTPGQRTKMNTYAQSHSAKLRAYETQLREKAKTDKDVKPDQKVLLGYFQQLREGVLSSLTDKQLKRLRELSLQKSGLVGLLDSQVAAKVGVPAAKLTQLRSTYEAGARKSAELEQAAMNRALADLKDRKPKDEAEGKKLQEEAQRRLQAEGKNLQPQILKIQNETRTKMLALLTQSEKDKYKALQGSPFNWSSLK
jgi:hypothetical protein